MSSTIIPLSSLNGTTGFRLDGVFDSDLAGVSVAWAGDVNRDGYADIIVGAAGANPNGDNSGSSYVVFGKASGWTATISLGTLNGSNGFRLDGVAANDEAGSSVGPAGDVNGDGYADLIVAALGADNAGNQSSSSYIVFGKASGWTPTVNLASLNGTTGFRLDGTTTADFAGYSVTTAGDVNGDGYADLIIGAPYSAATTVGGNAFLVFGRASGWSPTMSLSSLDGSNGVRLVGASAFDTTGFSVASAGDVNGDGFADLIVGAPYNDATVNDTDTGAGYIVFGKASGWTATLALSGLDGTNGVRLVGDSSTDFSGPFFVTNGDKLGWSVASAGDVNGDGFADIILGAPSANRTGAGSGAVYVVFGKLGGWAASTNVSTLNGSNGFRLNGVTAGLSIGTAVSGAGDLNGDGYADLIIGVAGAEPNGFRSGSTYVLYGKASGWAASINLPGISGSAGFRLDGAAAREESGGSVRTAGDVDGDGFSDIIIGARTADPLGPDNNAGSAYVYFSPATGGAFYRGTSLVDVLRGTPDADVMNGYGRDDQLFGNAGADTLDGGTGNDTLDGGAGSDTASYATASAAVTVTLLSQGGTQNTLGAGTDTLVNFENLLGSDLNDTLTGDGNANVIEGGLGNDLLNGGGGSDTASYAGAASAVLVGLVLQGQAQNTLGAGTDTLAGFENLLGSAFGDTLGGDTAGNILSGGGGNDVLFGDAGDDTLQGGAGNDILYGGPGNDSMAGGTGDDSYVVDASGDVVTEAAGEGFDQVFVTVTGWTAALNIEAVYLYGSVTVQLGSAGADVLVYNSSNLATSLDGSAGDDVLWGGGGNDTLVGGTGNDVLRGQLGDDVLTGGAGNDQLVGGLGADRFVFGQAGWGYDQLFDFNRAEGDLIDMRGSGVTSLAGFTAFYVAATGMVATLGGARIDFYGVTDLTAADFIFA